MFTPPISRKKPPGGVDLFGGADVFGIGKKEGEGSKAALPKTKQISMFDEDEKDDDSASIKVCSCYKLVCKVLHT